MGASRAMSPARHGALLAAFRVADGLATDQARTHLRDDLGFAVPLLSGVGLAVFIGHRDVKCYD